jgi:hypothetical protein
VSEDAGSAPVTVVVARRVKREREADYEAWLSRLQTDARAFPGYLGVTTHRPAPAGPAEYTSVFRFDSVAHLREFERSKLRADYLAEVVDLVEADAAWQELTGLEFWFAPPPGTVVPQPSRLRMSLVMIVVVFALVLAIGQLVAAVLSGWPYPVRLLVTIAIEIFLMTYWLMPRLTRWLARWIYPSVRAVGG